MSAWMLVLSALFLNIWYESHRPSLERSWIRRRQRYTSSGRCHSSFMERFKLIPSGVSSLFLLDVCLWSRLTSGPGLLHSRACSVRWPAQSRGQSLSFRSCLLHACSRAWSIRWPAQSRGQSLSAFVAGSLRVPFKQANYRVTGSVTRSISDAPLKQAHCSGSYLLHVCSKACSVRWPAQLRGQLSDAPLKQAHCRSVSTTRM